MATGHKRRGRRQAGGHPFEKGVDVVNFVDDVLKNFLNGMGVGHEICLLVFSLIQIKTTSLIT